MNKIKLALIMAALLSSNIALADEKKPNQNTNSPKVLKSHDNSSFLDKITGIKDTSEDRSIKEGAKTDIVAFFPEEPTIKELGLDEDKLAKDVNIHHKQVADYFKSNPNYKGAFISFFTFYPGYKKPYQYPLDSKDKKTLEMIKAQNKKIAELSSCNEKKFCGTLVLHKYDFLTKKIKTDYNNAKLEKHLDSYKVEKIKHYPTKKNNLNPIHFITIMGTNGFKVSESDALSLIQLAREGRI